MKGKPIVYFVGGIEGPVKIGWTQQPMRERLKCIQNGSPVKLIVLAILPAERPRERWYHKVFAPYRLHGEWFERSPLVQREIDWINGVPGVSPVTGCPSDYGIDPDPETIVIYPAHVTEE